MKVLFYMEKENRTLGDFLLLNVEDFSFGRYLPLYFLNPIHL